MPERPERLDRLDAAPRPLVTPSILDCDFARVGEELAALEGAGVRAVHLDVMDGHFVPNLSYGPPVIADWRPRTGLPFDAHLMISDPARYLDAFVQAGCDVITFHVEAVPQPLGLIREIRRAGCRAALALNPPTPLESVMPFLAEVDKILVMSVMPGFGGQSFEASVLDKVRALRAARPTLEIAIDGGIKPGTATQAVAAGVTQLVVGSFIWRADGNYAASLAELAEATARGTGEAMSRPPFGRLRRATMTQVILIRPGATVYDEQERIQGVLDVPLSDRGKREVALLAERLAGAEVSALYCGPGESVERTADAVGKALGLRPKRIEDLRNLDQGLWQGLHLDEIKRRNLKLFRQWQEDPRTICPPNGETVEEAMDRIKAALRPLIRRHRSETLGLVAGEPLAQLISCYLRRDPRVQLDDEVPTGGFETIDVPEDGSRFGG